MSRQSGNELVDNVVRFGYDYDWQCWVEDFIVQRCGHNGPCNCFGRINEGLDIREIEGAK